VSYGVRAKGLIRRFSRANRLDRLATLTYAREPATLEQVKRDLRWFFERFRKRFGRRALVAVIERGDKSGRLHVHFACNFFLHVRVLARLWTHGIVDIRKAEGGGERWEQRRLAKYLAKYVAKSVADVAEEGPKERRERQHRYHITQGFTPQTFRLRYARPGHAYERMLGLYGQPDTDVDFGDAELGLIYGVWYGFPDHCLHPPPRGWWGG